MGFRLVTGRRKIVELLNLAAVKTSLLQILLIKTTSSCDTAIASFIVTFSFNLMIIVIISFFLDIFFVPFFF